MNSFLFLFQKHQMFHITKVLGMVCVIYMDVNTSAIAVVGGSLGSLLECWAGLLHVTVRCSRTKSWLSENSLECIFYIL